MQSNGAPGRLEIKEMAMKKIFLSNTDRKIGGVCGGLGEYFEMDSTIFRVIFILIAVLSWGIGIIAYLLVWAVIPRKPKV